MDSAFKDSLILTCVADKNFAMPVTVMLKSVGVNLGKNSRAKVYIIYNKIGKGLKNKITESLKTEPLAINWIKADDNLLKNVVLTKRITVAAYYKILIPNLLPQTVKKVIYLDSDLILNSDLYDLWGLDVNGYYLLATSEVHPDCRYASSQYGLRLYKELGIDPNAKIFNNAVMVMDIEKFRKDNIPEKIIEYIAKNRKYINWWDQDGFNAILFDRWKEIDPRWNQPYHIYDFASWKESPFDEETYNNVINHPYIIHFNTFMKPWVYYCNHPKKDLFFYYLDMTKWAGFRPKEESKLLISLKAKFEKLKRLLFNKRG